MILTKDDIEEIEIDLTGICNLSCYICSRNFKHAQYMVKKNIRPLSQIIAQIDQFTNLKRFVCAGTLSEPTLHPEFLQLIAYLNSRNLKYEIFTNANTHDLAWWKLLGEKVNAQSRTVFTVCGSTQELHEYYRVGSSLQQILDNAAAYRKNGKKNDWVQHILFEYNKEDYKNNMHTIFEQFSHHFQVQSEGRRRLNEKLKDCPAGICPVHKVKSVQDMLFSKMKPLNSKDVAIECESYRCKKLYINQFGKVAFCFTHAEFENDYIQDLDNIDYSKVYDYNYYDCFLCSKLSRMYMDQLNLTFIC